MGNRQKLEEKKIGFIISGLGMGGAEKFLVNLTNHFYKEGYDLVLIILSDKQELLPELDQGIKTFTILRKYRFDIFVSRQIKRVIEEEKITTIFCVNVYSFFITKLALIFNKKIKIYLSIHSTIPISKKIFFQNIVYFRFLSKNETIIYLCNNQKKYLQKKYLLPKTYSRIINNGINITYFDPALIQDENILQLKSQYYLKPDDKVILQVARLQDEKRHSDAIGALQLLHQSFNNKAHLLIVGSGTSEYTTYLKRIVKESAMEGYVHFLGGHSDVRKFYSISDLFTLTSSSETFSLAALEAMSFGLPCSLTDVGGASEMITEGISGRLSIPLDLNSIASSWSDILNGDFNRVNIRNSIVNNFNEERMFNEYKMLLGSNN